MSLKKEPECQGQTLDITMSCFHLQLSAYFSFRHRIATCWVKQPCHWSKVFKPMSYFQNRCCGSISKVLKIHLVSDKLQTMQVSLGVTRSFPAQSWAQWVCIHLFIYFRLDLEVWRVTVWKCHFFTQDIEARASLRRKKAHMFWGYLEYPSSTFIRLKFLQSCGSVGSFGEEK
jgi:hypothetical protein